MSTCTAGVLLAITVFFIVAGRARSSPVGRTPSSSTARPTVTSSTPNDVSPETNERSGRIRAKRNVGDSLVDLETLAQNVASRANDAFTNYCDLHYDNLMNETTTTTTTTSTVRGETRLAACRQLSASLHDEQYRQPSLSDQHTSNETTSFVDTVLHVFMGHFLRTADRYRYSAASAISAEEDYVCRHDYELVKPCDVARLCATAMWAEDRAYCSTHLSYRRLSTAIREFVRLQLVVMTDMSLGVVRGEFQLFDAAPATRHRRHHTLTTFYSTMKTFIELIKGVRFLKHLVA